MSNPVRRRGVTSSNFVAVDRDAYRRLGENPVCSNRQLRIVALAMSRLEPKGHAHFDQGELRRLLSRVDERTGELKEPSRDSITRDIRTLEESGFLLPGSWLRDLRMPMFDVQYGRSDRDNSMCPKKPPGCVSNLHVQDVA